MTAPQSPEACPVCVAGGYPEFCSDGHTPSVVRLAEVIDRSLAGPPGHLEPHPEWYIEDAEAIADDVAEGDGWVLEHEPGFLGDYFKVNGVEFWLDVNAEGFNTPILGSQHRADLAADAEDDFDV